MDDMKQQKCKNKQDSAITNKSDLQSTCNSSFALFKNCVKKISIPHEKKIKQKDYLSQGTIPVIDQGETFIGGYTNDANTILKCPFPVIVFGDHTKTIKLVNFDFAPGADGIKVLKPTEQYDIRFFFYAMQYVTGKMQDRGYSRNYQYLEKELIPTFSLPEQKRIVEKIDELFSDLDAAESELQVAKEKLNIFRLTVLDQAFTGKLSTFNRTDDINDLIQKLFASQKDKKHFSILEKMPLPNLPEDWCWICVGDISTGVEYGSSQKSLPKGEIPVIRMGNIQEGKIDYNDLVYSSDAVEIAKYMLHSGDVLFNRTNSPELVGKTGIYLGEQPAIFAGYLIRLNHIQKMVDSKYLNYFLNSNIAVRYGNKVKTDGVNQSNINGTKLCSYPFPFCSLEKQKQVVEDIEQYLALYERIYGTVFSQLEKTKALRQGILKQAFEGGLV